MRRAPAWLATLLVAGAAAGCSPPGGDGAADAGPDTLAERAGGREGEESASARTDSAPTVRILAPPNIAEAASALSDRHPALRVEAYHDRRELLARLPGARGLITWDVTPAIAEAGRDLRWIHSLSAGVDGALAVPRVQNDPELVLTSMKILKGPEAADHAMALLLALTRDLPRFIRNMDAGRWGGGSELPIVELRGRTLLVIGLGGIGTQLAERAHAHGMRVIATDPKDIPLMGAVEYAGKPDELPELLGRADVVAVCAPLTPGTRGLLDADAFDRMRDGVYLVSVSRGEIVDTGALVAALRSGKVRAAGLDVVDPEPLPAEHPLWSMPQVVITPHIAGLSEGRREREEWLAVDNIERFVEGRPLRNVIDRRLGY